jgi:hypothetical protein
VEYHRLLSPRVASRAAQALLQSVGSATSQAAGIARRPLVDLPVARTVSQALAGAVRELDTDAGHPSTSAVDPASRTTAYRLGHAVMKMTIGNPMAKTATTIWLEVAVRAASTPPAQAAVDSMLTSVKRPR